VLLEAERALLALAALALLLLAAVHVVLPPADRALLALAPVAILLLFALKRIHGLRTEHHAFAVLETCLVGCTMVQRVGHAAVCVVA